MSEIGLTEAAARLERSPEVIAKKAVEALTVIARRSALKAKKLPGRKIGRVWLFHPRDVASFKRIKRPPGRPGKP